MTKHDPWDRFAGGLEDAIDRAEAEAHLCPDCGRRMHRAGFTWSGRQRRQVWRCQGCGRTRIVAALSARRATEAKKEG